MYRIDSKIRTVAEASGMVTTDDTGKLNTVELLSVFLNSSDLAQEVVMKLGSDKEKFTYKNLVAIPGIGDKTAKRILAMVTFSGRMFYTPIKVGSSEDAYTLCHDITGKEQEHLVLITVDGSGALIKKRTVFKGTVNQSLIHPREIFNKAIKDRAAAIILAHNHPSGSLAPSTEDIEVTGTLVKAGKIMGIPVLDHIIVSKKGYCSLHAKGMI